MAKSLEQTLQRFLILGSKIVCKAVARPPFCRFGEINYICFEFIISGYRGFYEKDFCGVEHGGVFGGV